MEQSICRATASCYIDLHSLKYKLLCIYKSLAFYLFLDLSSAKLHLREGNQIIENRVQTSVFNLLTNSMSVNGQVYDTANWHAGFCKHFICKETLSCGDSPTCDQDISRIKYTRGANFTKLCRRHQETSTTISIQSQRAVVRFYFGHS